MVNADPSYIPENETDEEREYREYLIEMANREEEECGIRPIFEIPVELD